MDAPKTVPAAMLMPMVSQKFPEWANAVRGMESDASMSRPSTGTMALFGREEFVFLKLSSATISIRFVLIPFAV